MRLLVILLILVVISVLFYEIYLSFKKRTNLIVKDIRLWNIGLILSISWMILALLYIKINLKELIEAYQLIIPKYYKSMFKLFDYTELQGQYRILSRHLRNFGMYVNCILQIIIATVWLLRGMRHYIGKDGIYTLNGNYKWKRVDSFTWGDKQIRRGLNGMVEYYQLDLIINN